MKDLVVILMALGFFALCVVYVALCDRIVGPDEQAGDGAESEAADGTTATATTVGSAIGAIDGELTR